MPESNASQHTGMHHNSLVELDSLDNQANLTADHSNHRRDANGMLPVIVSQRQQAIVGSKVLEDSTGSEVATVPRDS